MYLITYSYEIHLKCIIIPQYQFSSVAQSCLTPFDPMNRSMPGLPVHHQLLEFTQTHVHWIGDACIDLKIFQNSLKILNYFHIIYFEVTFNFPSYRKPILNSLDTQYSSLFYQHFLTCLWIFLTTLIEINNKIPWYHFNGRKWRGTKEPLDEVKEETERLV